MAKRINCVLLILFLSLNSGYDEIVERPRNTLTSVGEKTVLKCCFHNRSAESTWSKYTDNGHGHKRKICIKETCPHSSSYKIDTTVPGCNDLLIVSSSKSDSTLYECNDAKGHKAAGYVATYKCSTNISIEDDLVKGDIVTFRCHITSHNKPKFKADWKFENGTRASEIHFFENQNEYESTLTVTAQIPELPPLTWTLDFLNYSVGDEQIDTTTPTAYWTSKRIKVAYPVTNVRTDCIDGACQRVLGDSIRCVADGFPSPDFSWLNEDGVEIGRGAMLKLNSPETQKYKCVARNLIRGTPHTKYVVVKVFIGETKGDPDSKTIRNLLYVVILLLVSKGLYTSKAKVLAVWRKIKRRLLGMCPTENRRPIETSEEEPLQMVERGANNSLSPSDDHAEQLEEKKPDDKRKSKTSRINPDVDDDYYNGNSESCQGQVDECQQDEIVKENGESSSIIVQLHLHTEVDSDIPAMEVNHPPPLTHPLSRPTLAMPPPSPPTDPGHRSLPECQ